MPSFSAALLAGGNSTRMGRDKALLPVPDSSGLLWQRQLQVLENLRPDEIFWSGTARPNLPAHVHLVEDEVNDAGPLAGISASLNLVKSNLLIVLAIDLPKMPSHLLQKLLSHCTEKSGAIFQNENFFEPLAAIYPKNLHSLAQECLNQKTFALQGFVRQAVDLHLLKILPVTELEAPLFKNLNSPADL